MKKQEMRKGSLMYKSQLQEFAQKAAIPPPVYDFVKEGASHEPCFKAIVILNGVRYESEAGFPNLKSAEHAAAKCALDDLQASGWLKIKPSPVHESGLCKNLLQEYAQKNSLPLPVYQSQRAGEDHAPTFTSSVEIAGVKYSGGFAKNKKEAEIKAARTALLAIQYVQSSVESADITVTATPQAHVGLATHINSHLSSTNGKKRGRGALDAVDEPAPARIKKEDGVEAETSDAVPTPKKSADIADLLATPTAQQRLLVASTKKSPDMGTLISSTKYPNAVPTLDYQQVPDKCTRDEEQLPSVETGLSIQQ